MTTEPGDAEHGVTTVHARLRGAIIRGELAAGQVVSQVQLAERYGVSRTPLREALRLLEREGLILSEPRRRVLVAPFSVEDLEQIYAMRIHLEALAVRISIDRLTDADIARMRDLEQEMRRQAAAQDYDGWHKPHHDFHDILIGAAGQRLHRAIAQLSDHAERYRHAYTVQVPLAWDNGIAEHHAIFEAAARRDVQATCAAVARHYGRVALNAVALVAPEHDPRPVREAVRLALQVPAAHQGEQPLRPPK